MPNIIGSNPISFLKVWTEQNVDPQTANLKNADQLAKQFVEDAAAQGFSLAQFIFNEASLIRYITQAMASARTD